MINYQFFPRSHGVTPEIKAIIDCFKQIETKLEDERSVTSSLVPHSFDSLLSVAFPEATLESTWICATLPPRWFQAASPSVIETISVSARTASESAAQMAQIALQGKLPLVFMGCIISQPCAMRLRRKGGCV